mmetsp:Transcript_963/g.2183  ORF Transcript_963/g.2183 Transcript_963/m.2183 type:complete len:212 (+) Transcript_963:1233-1868(+)
MDSTHLCALCRAPVSSNTPSIAPSSFPGYQFPKIFQGFSAKARPLWYEQFRATGARAWTNPKMPRPMSSKFNAVIFSLWAQMVSLTTSTMRKSAASPHALSTPSRSQALPGPSQQGKSSIHSRKSWLPVLPQLLQEQRTSDLLLRAAVVGHPFPIMLSRQASIIRVERWMISPASAHGLRSCNYSPSLPERKSLHMTGAVFQHLAAVHVGA